MARLARVVFPDLPYHVTHRGNRRGDVFFSDKDRMDYMEDLARCADVAGLEIWAYCLMTNHVHLIAVPRRADSLARAIGRAHQRHARRINRARRWLGHLWANRYYSTPLDEYHLWTAVKYVELNPVRARLTRHAEDWPWSSARAHADRRRRDPLLAPDRPLGGARPHPLTGRPMSWLDWLRLGLEREAVERLRLATSTGRPCGDEPFVRTLETQLSRTLAPQPPGPKAARRDPPNQRELF